MASYGPESGAILLVCGHIRIVGVAGEFGQAPAIQAGVACYSRRVVCIQEAAMSWGGARKGAGRPRVGGNTAARKITLLLPERQIQTLDDAADKLGLTRTEVIRTLIDDQLARAKRSK